MAKRGEILFITTDRLTLMPMTAEAMENILKRTSQDKPLMHRAADGWPSSNLLAALQTFSKKLKKDPSTLGWYVWTVTHPNTGIIGEVCFGGKPDSRGQITMKYEIVPEYRCQGYGTEAVSAVVKWAFDKIAVKGIIAYCPEENIPSVKILTCLGMQRVEQVEEPEIPNSQVWKWEITRQEYRMLN